MSKEPTPHELLEIIQNQAFKDIDLSQVLTMNDEQLCIFSLEQMERLRATRGSIAALWLSDQSASLAGSGDRDEATEPAPGLERR